MSALTGIKKAILCGGAEEAEYSRVKDELRKSNRGIVKGFSLLSAVILAAMFFASLAVKSLSGNRMLYGGGFLAAVVIYVVAVFPGKNNATLMLADMYLFSAALFCVGIVLGTVLGPKEISATYIAFLLAIPQLFTDRPYRMYILIVTSVIVFIAAVIRVKDPSTWNSDITNAVVFGFISLILCTYSINTRVSRYCLQERIRFMAENDQLTGLKNRNYYEQSLASAAILGCKALFCVYVDVNGLHELNDTQGHEAGDRMLQYVASVMQHQFGEKDTFRIGGDEFVALGVDKDYDTVLALTENMKHAVESAGYHISVGISHKLKNGIEIDALVKEAEMQMYSDKTAYYQQNGLDRRRKH